MTRTYTADLVGHLEVTHAPAGIVTAILARGECPLLSRPAAPDVIDQKVVEVAADKGANVSTPVSIHLRGPVEPLADVAVYIEAALPHDTSVGRTCHGGKGSAGAP